MIKRFVCLLIVVCLASCSQENLVPLKPKILHINIHQEPPTMDPRKGSDWVSLVLHFNLFEGLMRLNTNGSLTPAQAVSVDISEDLLVYTFHLRDTFWSNGEPVTAQDFEASWKRILSPDFPAPNALLLYCIKNAEKAKKGEIEASEIGITSFNDKTLVVTLERPSPYFLNLVSFPTFFPVYHKLDKQTPGWASEATPSFISNGSFSLGTWQHQNEIILQKNPLYWDKAQIKLDQIHISMVADSYTALQMFEQGELDVIGLGISPIPPDALHKYAREGRLKINNFPATTILCFNLNAPPFNNWHIRKAFAYSLNRKEITQNIAGPEGNVASDVVPPVLKNGITASFVEDKNLKLAQEHLKKGLLELNLSLDHFPEIIYSYTASGVNHALAQAIQEQLTKNLGIKVTLEKSDYKTHLDKLYSRSYQIAQAVWVAQYRDPMNILERFKYKINTKNYPGWENPTFIELLEKSIYESTDEERLKKLRLAEEILAQDLPFIPLYHWSSTFMVQPYVSGYETSPSGVFDYSHLQIN